MTFIPDNTIEIKSSKIIWIYHFDELLKYRIFVPTKAVSGIIMNSA